MSRRATERRQRLSGDRVLGAIGAASAACICVALFAVGAAVVALARPSLSAFGWSFVTGTEWAPLRGRFGALPFVYGTVVTSALALVLAVPISLGVAVFLTDLGPSSLRRPVHLLVDLLAAIPSVVYGLWAAVVVAPVLRRHVEPALEAAFGSVPLFRGPYHGVGLLCGGVVLAIMIVPTIASIAREVLAAVPSSLREAGLALGATRWDVVRRIVLPHARAGIGGAVLLGVARAVGETMAMAAAVGSQPRISASLFAPGYTMASVIANEFASASSELHVAALAEVGLVLFAVTVAFNVAARMLVSRAAGRALAKESP